MLYSSVSELLGIKYMSFVSFLKSKLCQYVDRVRDNNRLRTGVGRFNSNMYTWGLADSPYCTRGLELQTAQHILHHCPLSNLSTS